VQNPVRFSSATLIEVLGMTHGGKNYREIWEWLRRMTLTGVESQGVVYFAGRKKYARDLFHVFQRTVAIGEVLEDGSVAEENYVWLSDWQLENLNNRHTLPIDYDVYKTLQSHIAKALVHCCRSGSTRAGGSAPKSGTPTCARCWDCKEPKNASSASISASERRNGGMPAAGIPLLMISRRLSFERARVLRLFTISGPRSPPPPSAPWQLAQMSSTSLQLRICSFFRIISVQERSVAA